MMERPATQRRPRVRRGASVWRSALKRRPPQQVPGPQTAFGGALDQPRTLRFSAGFWPAASNASFKFRRRQAQVLKACGRILMHER
jgi:hypothetical protein